MSWTRAEEDELQRRLAEGQAHRQMADGMGKTLDAVASKAKRAREAAQPPLAASSLPQAVPSDDLAAMQQSSEAAEIQRLKTALAEARGGKAPQRVPVETEVDNDDYDAAAEWQRQEQQSQKKILYVQKRRRFAASFDEPVIAVAFCSDQHIAPGTPVDFTRMRQDAELIQRTPGLYCILGGDGVDNHIAIRQAGLAARSQPSDQWKLFRYYVGIMAEKVICLISGNHEAWTDQMAGLDVLADIARSQRLCYSPDEARVSVKLGKQEYKLAVRHKYRFNSSDNMGHTVKKWFSMGPEPFDIGAVCHHHEPSVEAFIRHGQPRWACRPGSYQITSAYAAAGGFNDTMPTCPTFLLFRERREIQGFWDVRQAVRTLAAERA